MESTHRVHRMDWMDYGRLVAAVWVLTDHYCFIGIDPRVNTQIDGYGFLTTIGAYGMGALQFFFISSGLVITLIAPGLAATEFASRRLVRVLPTYVVCLTLTALLTQDRPVHPLTGLGQYLANLTLFPTLFGHRPIDAVYWTLGVELIFYLGVFLVLATRQTKRLRLIIAAWVLAQLVFLPLHTQLPLLSSPYHFIAAGAVMALMFRGEDLRLTLPLLAASLLLCVHSSYVYTQELGTFALPQMAFVVLLFLLFPMMRGRDVHLPFARRIGSLTYPFYLLHFQIGLMLIAQFGTAHNRWYLLAALTAGLFVASLLIDDIIEFRLRRLWERLIGGGVDALANWLAERWRATPRPVDGPPPVRLDQR